MKINLPPKKVIGNDSGRITLEQKCIRLADGCLKDITKTFYMGMVF